MSAPYREPDTVNAKWSRREIGKLQRALIAACDALQDEQDANFTKGDRNPIIDRHRRTGASAVQSEGK